TPDEAARYDGGGFHSGSVTYTENQRGEDSHRYDGRTFHDGRGVYAGE
ncbi:phage tail protein I, partial [Klebsiella pneumoniae]|nr:phage tail protein I [Klebsiella pneumoniae]